jgi:hypothetical protein
MDHFAGLDISVKDTSITPGSLATFTSRVILPVSSTMTLCWPF